MADVVRFPAARRVRQVWPPPSYTSFDGVERLDDHPMRCVDLPTDVEPKEEDDEG